MTALTPAKWIQVAGSAPLRAKLEELATKWENLDLGASESMFGAIHGEANFRDAARQLREVLAE